MTWRLLGPVEAVVRGERVPLGRPQQRAVLAYLLLNANVVVSAEQLAEALWGGALPTRARAQVQVCVSRLRQLTRAAGIPETLHSDSGGYRLELAGDDLDVVVFSGLTEAARRYADSGEHERATTLLRQALALWRGPALAGASAAFVPAAAAGLHDKRLAASEDLFDAEFALGRHAAAVAPLRELVTGNPWHEGLAVRLMTALAGSGHQAEALRVFERIRRLLADELGIEPGARLAEAHVRLLRQQFPSSRPAPRVRETGSGLRPAQLPAGLSTFTGRGDALAAMDTMLNQARDSGALAVVAIIGTAGVGKTALAIRWAHRVRPLFDDGQLFLDLRGYSPGATVAPLDALSRCLRALGVPPAQVPDDVDEATDLYRSVLADRRVLILLDNARDTAHVRPLLPGGAGCLVIVTSRDRLGGLAARHDAQRLPLDVLTPQEASELLTRVIGADRVADQRDALAELAHDCAHLPLALRIAAADLHGRPHEMVSGYLARLRAGDPLTVLTVRDDEQIAVRSAFAASYQTLPPRLQRLFRLFGLVPGCDVTAESAAAMLRCGAGEAADMLSRIADAHLAQERTPGHFGTHDLLGRYVTELAKIEDDRERLDDLLSWYLFSVHAAADRLYPQVLRVPTQLPAPAGPPMRFAAHVDALAWLDAHRHNLVAVARHAAHRELHTFAWSLADALRGYLWLGMHTTEWSEVARIGLSAARADRHEQAEAAARLSLAALHWRLERFPEAIDDYRLALLSAKRSGWRDGEAAALGNLGPVFRMTGQPGEALRVMEQALELSRRNGRTAGVAVNHNNLGLVCADLGRLREAADHHHAALTLAHQGGAASSRALILSNLGVVQHLLGRSDDALQTLTEALELHEQTGSRGRATTLCALARVHCDRGDHPQAASLARQALDMARAPVEPRVEALALHILGIAEGKTGTLLDALRTARTTADRYIEADITVSLAEIDEPAAPSWCHAALSITRQCGYLLLEGRTLAARAAAEYRAGDVAAAWRSARLAAQSHALTGHQPGAERIRKLLTLLASESSPGPRSGCHGDRTFTQARPSCSA
ncbi:AfsR/SARP family transcriptional regulator [Micromonospora cathayae]|uniref:BTAD domain-containing putative transcriptional regulator n=1 Tax=Micromonospora cathayae TaxID=3028804 RepID=A0ABY7ZSJ8_9ACTN|nr:AfsR/SARP family transcriptional regulator [Micromonospora sp. HUAS 3]WDZ85875.1 BTAD domain-containing putative transcriptional regulator [Micromonospora sp. HUAS 3]